MGSDRPGSWNGPFLDALGPSVAELSPAVRRHLVPAAGAGRYEGFLRRIWHRGIPGRIVSRLLHLRGEERGVFRLENRLVHDLPAMTWLGTHVVKGEPVHRRGLMRWEPDDRVLVDRIGPGGWLEVELVPRIDGGAVTMTSARQWVRLAGLRLRLPRWLFGGAATREWEEPDGRLGLRLALHHPLFGEYAGYEAVFAPVAPA
jgi:hypothetical protein